jgi:hypothetical protein
MITVIDKTRQNNKESRRCKARYTEHDDTKVRYKPGNQKHDNQEHVDQEHDNQEHEKHQNYYRETGASNNKVLPTINIRSKVQTN